MQRGDPLVAAQVTALAGIGWPGRARWRLTVAVRAGAAGAVLVGAALGAVAAAAHGGRLTPRVSPHPEAALLQHGPYRWSRHPVYAGLLLAAAGAAVLRARPEPLVAAAALAGVLHVKVGHEEVALRQRFGPEWVVYAARTPRLVGLPRR